MLLGKFMMYIKLMRAEQFYCAKPFLMHINDFVRYTS